ncbi:MAG: HAD family phosphatase [Acidobacteriota bacterium]|nr:HAD family phosphatase [Acidobacteriota bacterium]
MALRAVVFDYGMVLTGPPDRESHDALLRITGLPHDRFEALYWADRHAYDEGKLSGVTFWKKFLTDASLDLGPGAVDELNRWDARMWTTQNPVMLAWQQALKKRGLRTAILSNMGDSVLANMQREFDWLDRFDVLVWSYQHGIAKPDPAIYRHTLTQLGTQPGEALFIDDKPVNVEAARALGMQGLVFSTVDQLRADLTTHCLAAALPIP